VEKSRKFATCEDGSSLKRELKNVENEKNMFKKFKSLEKTLK